MSAGALPAANPRDRVRGALFKALLISCVLLSGAVLVTLIVDVIADGGSRLSLDFLGNPASFNPVIAGIYPALMGTLWLMALCILFIVPVGVATAVYLEEYADRTKWWNRAIEINIQNLAAVPSIVYGILGLAFIVRGPLSLKPVVLAGSLTLALNLASIRLVRRYRQVYE